MPIVVRRLAFASVAVVAGLALTGCAPESQIEPWAFGTPQPVATTVEESEGAVDPGSLAAGDTISEDLARDLNRDLQDGLRGYELADGTFVVVKPNEPLPEPVRADAEAKAAAVPVVTEWSPA